MFSLDSSDRDGFASGSTGAEIVGNFATRGQCAFCGYREFVG
jgi:hypothetical protein